MPPTLVNVAVGILLGVALLGAAFDRRSILVVGVAAAIPDLDAAISLLGIGATNATLHSIFVPIAAGMLLYYDTEIRENSWLKSNYGWYGARVAWVALAAYALAGIGLDLFSNEGVVILYPFSDRYYAVVGGFLLSTQEGVIQTYISFGDGWFELATPGTIETHHVETWTAPAGETRRLRLIDSGWQAVLVITAVVSVPAKYLIERQDRLAAGER